MGRGVSCVCVVGGHLLGREWYLVSCVAGDGANGALNHARGLGDASVSELQYEMPPVPLTESRYD